MRFAKVHGAGNDFVLVDLFRPRAPSPSGSAASGDLAPPRLLPEAAARFVCDRHQGIGADGLLFAGPSERAALRMRIQNADGSEAEMCGNGLRCVVKYAVDAGHVRAGADGSVTVETGRGVLTTFVTRGARGLVDSVRVAMGAPIFAPAEVPFVPPPGTVASSVSARGAAIGAAPPAGLPFIDVEVEPIAGRRLVLSAVSMGNPHAVLFTAAADRRAADPGTPDADALRALALDLGPQLQRSPMFPRSVNVEVVACEPPAPGAPADAPPRLRTVVYERGVGLTQACGTGACAVGVAAALSGRAPFDVELPVELPGGTLHIRVPRDLDTVWMRGPAATVFHGELELPVD